jgi:hypothetical protein
VLKRSLPLRLETEVFMNKKGKVAAELNDEKWLRDVELLWDISYHVNDFNI